MKNASRGTHGLSMAEAVGFEPTCPFRDNRISSAARYGLFDTLPCLVTCLSYTI